MISPSLTVNPSGCTVTKSKTDTTGYNIGMSIVPSNKDCPAPSCSANINEKCPAVLRTGIDQTGVNTGCLSSCKGGFGMEVGGNRACCSGGESSPCEY
jgi:hypothetical protein